MTDTAIQKAIGFLIFLGPFYLFGFIAVACCAYLLVLACKQGKGVWACIHVGIWTLFLLGCINTAANLHFNSAIGGSADLGFISPEEGAHHFYVSSHGKQTEVSEGVWRMNRWHGRFSHWILLGTTAAMAFSLLWLRRRRNDALPNIATDNGRSTNR